MEELKPTVEFEIGDEDSCMLDVRLTPHRSLSARGFVILMTAVCLVSFTAGLAFFLAGAWPVVGFLGIDVLLIYLAFQINYRRGQMYESLQLTEDSLVVRRVSHYGTIQTWRFQPFWLQILIDDPPDHDSPLILRSHGKTLRIGSFLTPAERVEVARALRDALVRWRDVPAGRLPA